MLVLVNYIPLVVTLWGKCCSLNVLAHIVDGCKFRKALSSAHCVKYKCPIHGLFKSAVCITCATEDNMIDCRCDNGITVYSIVLQLDQTGVSCNGSSLTHYALWKFTNTISLFPFLISQTYTYVRYSNVTGVLSLDATCMVSWNHSVEYMYTQSRMCVWWGGGGGDLLDDEL